VQSRIRPWLRLVAYGLQTFAPLTWRPRRDLFFARRSVAAPEPIRIPTRHGLVRCFVYRPPADAPVAGGSIRSRPVHLQLHGGGFTGRYPAQDEHVATYIASEAGAFVVTVDYDVAPQVQFPVAEEQCYDVARWIFETAPANGWDPARISVGGMSAGGKLAFNVCQLAHASGLFRPIALVAAYAVADVTRSDRRSAKRHARVSPLLQRITNGTYFADASRRRDPLASPAFDPHLAAALPATLILTGEDDTLAAEMERLGATLRAAGADVVNRQFSNTDHGFTHGPPVATAREAIGLIGAFLVAAYAVR
jgi:acetyl esterase